MSISRSLLMTGDIRCQFLVHFWKFRSPLGPFPRHPFTTEIFSPPLTNKAIVKGFCPRLLKDNFRDEWNPKAIISRTCLQRTERITACWHRSGFDQPPIHSLLPTAVVKRPRTFPGHDFLLESWRLGVFVAFA